MPNGETAYVLLPLSRKIFMNRDLWADVTNKVLYPPVQIILQYGSWWLGGRKGS
jgi:hypothetical protein